MPTSTQAIGHGNNGILMLNNQLGGAAMQARQIQVDFPMPYLVLTEQMGHFVWSRRIGERVAETQGDVKASHEAGRYRQVALNVPARIGRDIGDPENRLLGDPSGEESDHSVFDVGLRRQVRIDRFCERLAETAFSVADHAPPHSSTFQRDSGGRMAGFVDAGARQSRPERWVQAAHSRPVSSSAVYSVTRKPISL